MALETPTSPPNPATAPEPAAQPALKPTRIRNEYPEAYDELEELERKAPSNQNGNGEPTAKTEGKPPAPAPKPATTKPPVPKAEPEPAQPREKPTPEAKTPESKEPEASPSEPDPTAKFTTAHDLRKDWRRLHRVVQDKDLELNKLREQLEKRAPVNEAALEENKTLKKRLEEAETELRYMDFTKSQKYKEDYEKPYQVAYESAIEEVQELWVNNEDGTTRPATAQDFQRILNASQQDVRALATKMFGEAANDVLVARRGLVELTRKANREAKEYREQATERERQRTLQAAEQRQQAETLWNKASEMLREKYPDFFKPIEGDEEYNKELEAGYATVDKAYAQGLTIEEMAARRAAVRHRAAAFRAQVLINRRLKTRVKELEGVVAEYEKSVPGEGKSGGEQRVAPAGDGYKSAEEEIDALAAMDRTEA